MSAAFFPQVQKVYVAYYGRPADPAGLQYWAGQLAANGGNLSAIINAFGNSAESTALYTGDNASKITAIYQQLFNRAPDAPGLAFYTAELTAGRMTAASIALNVANGAQGTDLTALNNKVAVGTVFTDALTVDGAASVAYQGGSAINAARSLLSGITTQATTTNVNSTVASIKASGGASSGQTFTLTADPDVRAGTSGSDTFTAPAGTLRKADVVVDSSATDKDVLNITLNAADIATMNAAGGNAGPTISGVESINVNIAAFDGTLTTLDAQNISSGTNLTLSTTTAGASGAAGVTNARGVNVTAGQGIAVLQVTGLSSGTVDTGNVLIAQVDADNTRTDTIRAKVNGDVYLIHTAAAGVRNAVIEATANTTIDLRDPDGAGAFGNGLGANVGVSAAGLNGLITTRGTGNIILRDNTVADLTGRFVKHEGSGTLTVRLSNTALGGLDLSNYTGISQLIVDAATTGAAIVPTGITITPRPGTQSYTSPTFNNSETKVGPMQDDVINVTLGGGGSGTLGFGGFPTVNFTQTNSQTVGAITQSLATSNTGAPVLGTTSLNFKGAGDLVLTTTPPAVAYNNGVAAGNRTDVIDASGISGGLTYTAPQTDAQQVLGGKSTNVITAATAAALNYVGQNAGDVIVGNISTGTLAVSGGTGNDAVRIADTAGAGNIPTTGTISVALGAGNDSVSVGLNAAGSTVAGVANVGTATGLTVGTVNLDAGAGTDTLRIATGVNFYGLGTLAADDAGNMSQRFSAVRGFERIELQEGDGGARAAIDVTAGTFLLNGSEATVAVRYGLDGAGVRWTVDGADNTRLHLNDNLGNSTSARNVDLSKVKFDITRLVDQFIVETGNNNDVITLPTTLANQQVRVAGNGGNDRIVVGDGPGIANIILGAGSDTVDLTKSTSANVIVFANGTGAAPTMTGALAAAVADTVTGTHTITGWKPQTLLDVDAFATPAVYGAGNAGTFAGAAGLGVLGTQSALATNLITVISTTGAAANLTLEGSAVITDFTSAEQLANYLGERYTTVATNEQVFAINNMNSGANKSYIWVYSEIANNPLTSGTANTVFNAADFNLVAVVENGGVGLTTANFSSIDQATLIGGGAAATANIWVV